MVQSFGALVIVLQSVLALLYLFTVESEWAPVCGEGRNASIVGDICADGGVMAEERYYKFYLDVALMMFVGFGYLMTFLQYYGLGAVGFTMLITALTVQWAILVEHLFVAIVAGDGLHKLSISFIELIDGNFAAACLLISFGALIGKVGPVQIVVMVLLEVVVFAFNKRVILMDGIGIADLGGSVVVHCFGAYFGLAVAFVLGVPATRCNDLAEASTISDVFSLIGTVFLWLYWPSFVTAMPEDSAQERTALLNTVFALLGSTVVTFGLSSWLEKRIRPVDIQNATLAGGVTIGSSANFSLTPAGALATGMIAGLVSTVGFCKLQPVLESKGLHDSCGVHNLHGMPSILGALVSAFFLAVSDPPSEGAAPMGDKQVSAQLTGVCITVIIAVLSGLVTGAILKRLPGAPRSKFVDRTAWEVAPDFMKDHHA